MSQSVWSAILDAIPDVGRWNKNLPEFKRLTEQYGQECRAFIKADAERRGYLWSNGVSRRKANLQLERAIRWQM